MTRRSHLTPKQRDELRAYLCDGAQYAALRAQSYDPRGSGGESMQEEMMLRRVGAFASGEASERSRQRFVHGARIRIDAATWNVLTLAYGPRSPDDRHDRAPDEIGPLLRLTDRVQMEANWRWSTSERLHVLATVYESAMRSRRGPYNVIASVLRVDEGLVVVPATATVQREIETEVIREWKPEILVGDEHVPGAIDQATAMLEDAEAAYLIAYRHTEREDKALREQRQNRKFDAVKAILRGEVAGEAEAIDPCLQRKREREAKGIRE